MRFKNLRTGNIVSTKDKGTIALMQKSANYEAVKATRESKPQEAEQTESEA